jgi:hypothetical protein
VGVCDAFIGGSSFCDGGYQGIEQKLWGRRVEENLNGV